MTPFHSPISDQSGTAGDLTWRLSGGALTISGTGAMPYYNGFDDPPTPWHFYRNSITAVVIEEGVTSIGSYAFISCYNLTSATIPGSVTKIGEAAFAHCSRLASVNIPHSVTRIGDRAFASCHTLASVNIPHSVTWIGDSAFAGWHSLASVNIPHSVTWIGREAFSSCSSLASITVEAGNPNYSSDNGVLFNKDKTVLMQYPAGKTGEYTIPHSVRKIEHYAFAGCRRLTSVAIPRSVTRIGEFVFSNCRNLTDVTVEWATPLPVPPYVFNNVPRPPSTLHVPPGTQALYKAADVWKRFEMIRTALPPVNYS